MGDRDPLRPARGKIRRTHDRVAAYPLVLILCEGIKTEPNYFRKFPITGDSVKGFGQSTTNLVREAIRMKAEKKYNQVWCVFDRDTCTAQDFNASLQLAESHGINVAYSNEAFELWFVLHFDFLHSGVSRSDYIERLNELLGCPYQKNCDTMYELLFTRQETAIRNAERLLSEYPQPDPVNDNPSTTVHLLVKQIKRRVWEE